MTFLIKLYSQNHHLASGCGLPTSGKVELSSILSLENEVLVLGHMKEATGKYNIKNNKKNPICYIIYKIIIEALLFSRFCDI